MSWFSKRRAESVTAPSARPPLEPPSTPAGGYAVIDIETTGLSPQRDRVLEIAVILTDGRGRVQDEWSQRINPQGPVGATHIHGIAQVDVADAPVFAEIVPTLNHRLGGLAVVAHNARFDLGFIHTEYANAGWDLPTLPTLCTLEASSYYLPLMDRRRLADCCRAAQIPLHDAHSALGDARATAALLAYYLSGSAGPPHPHHVQVSQQARSILWPTEPSRAATAPPARSRVHTRIAADQARRSKATASPALVQLLADFSLVDALDEGAPASSMPYLELLPRNAGPKLGDSSTYFTSADQRPRRSSRQSSTSAWCGMAYWVSPAIHTWRQLFGGGHLSLFEGFAPM